MADRQIPGKEMLEQNRALLAMQMEALQKKEMEKKEAMRGPMSYGGSVISESEGGIPLQSSLLDGPNPQGFGTGGGDGGQVNEFENLIEHASMSKDILQEPLIPESIYNQSEGGLSAATNSTAKAWLGNYPPLQPLVKGKENAKVEDLDDAMNNMSVSGSGQASTPGAWGNSAKKLFPDARPTPVPAGIDLENLKGIKVGEDAAEAQAQGPGTMMTVNAIDGQYHCPFPTCEFVFHSPISICLPC